MKNLYLIVGIIFLPYLLLQAFGQTNAQNLILNGEVLAEDGYPLIGATINTVDLKGTVSDENGRFRLEVDNSARIIDLQVRMLGFESLDTTVILSEVPSFLKFRLKKTQYDQPEIVVKEKRNMAFDALPWTILDMKSMGDALFILWYQAGKRYIGRIDQKGEIEEEYELKRKYNELAVSCSGRLYLLNADEALELAIVNGELYFVKDYARTQFDQFVQPCLINKNDKHLFREFLNHNKQASYYQYRETKEKKVIHQIFDEKAAKVANAYYQDVIRMYYYFTANPEENAIDEGEERVNILTEGTWDGDLTRLIINNQIHEAASYYLNVEAQPIAIQEFFKEGKLFVLDPVNEKVWRLDLATNKFETINVKGIDWNLDYEIVFNPETTPVFFKQENQLFEFILDKANEYSLKPVQILDIKGHYPRNFQIIEKNLFYYTQMNINRPQTKLFKVQLR